jgi:hypothetical protein
MACGADPGFPPATTMDGRTGGAERRPGCLAPASWRAPAGSRASRQTPGARNGAGRDSHVGQDEHTAARAPGRHADRARAGSKRGRPCDHQDVPRTTAFLHARAPTIPPDHGLLTVKRDPAVRGRGRMFAKAVGSSFDLPRFEGVVERRQPGMIEDRVGRGRTVAAAERPATVFPSSGLRAGLRGGGSARR